MKAKAAASKKPESSDLIEKATEASTLLKTISHPHRLMVCCALVENPCSVSELIDIVGISQTAMSNHLSALRQANIVDFTRDHRTLTYRLKDPKIDIILNAIHHIYCA